MSDDDVESSEGNLFSASTLNDYL